MTVSALDQLVKSAAAHFEPRYGRKPRWIVAAPGRVNLIGEHIDYNDGFVLPMAIDRYCVIAAGEVNDEARMTNDERNRNSSFDIRHSSLKATVYSATTDDEAVISLEEPARHPSPGHWSNYVTGAIAGCLAADLRPSGCNLVIDSTVPVGGGLSSSAALEVATATLMEAMTGIQLEPVAKALLCQKAEHNFAGVPCGIMDQFASVMCQADHLMLLDCRSRQIEQIPLVDPAVTVLIMNTNVKHELSGGEYAERRDQCEAASRKLGLRSLREATLQQLDADRSRLKEVEFRRARHAISEIERTVAAAAAFKTGKWAQVGELMAASHNSLRDDYEVSCRELDLLVEMARTLGTRHGVIGSRMTGGGFGGCTVSLVETNQVNRVAEQLMQSYHTETGIEPSVIISRPSRGAHIIRTA